MRRTLAATLLIVIVSCIVFLGGCKKGSSYSNPTAPANTPPTVSQPNMVVISGFAFGPSPITVSKGSTVTWQNKDNVAHTATADDGTWDTGNIAPGASKSLTFATAGTFAYHCTVHPMMRAALVVQ